MSHLFWWYYCGGGTPAPDPDPTPLRGILARLSVDLQFKPSAEALFDENGATILDQDGQPVLVSSDDWVSMTQYVRDSDPIVLEYGIRGSGIDNLVANAGVLSFSLDNGAWNRVGQLGYFSPLHANRWFGFNYDTPVRLVLGQTGYTDPYYKFYGKLADVSVVPGVNAERITRCTAVDLMDDYARTPAPAVDVQFDKYPGQLFDTLINALPTDLQPPLPNPELGLETFPVAFDDLHENTVTVREAINNLCMSSLGRCYFAGTSLAPGGLLNFVDRHYAVRNPLVLFTVTAADIATDGLSVPGSRDDLVSKVVVTTYPTRVDTVYQVLYALQGSSLVVQNGETFTGLTGSYVDPTNTGARIAGTDMQQPSNVAPSFDYQMNSAADGSGTDLTPFFVVTADFSYGTQVSFSITNNSGVPGYVTRLQVRGLGIYRYTSQMASDVVGNLNRSTLQIAMPYQGSQNVGRSVANYHAQKLANTLARASSVTVLANRSVNWLARGIITEPGHRIAISEEVTGLDEEEFIVNAVRLEIYPSAMTPLMTVTWGLEPADIQRMWRLGVSGFTRLGGTDPDGVPVPSTAILGY